MVAYLARCQLDPAMPRPSIETLLHAFVPAAHVDHTHPGRDRRPRRRGETASGWRASASATRPPGSRTSARASRSRSWSARRSHDTRPAARRARQARARDLGRHRGGGLPTRRSTRSTGPPRSSTSARRAPGASAAPRGPALDDATRHATLMRACCPRSAARCSLERPKLLCVDVSPEVLEFVVLAGAPALSQVGAACPDHLVHTKRLPLWVDFDPRGRRRRCAEERIASAAADFREAYRAYFARARGTGPAPDPNPASC